MEAMHGPTERRPGVGSDRGPRRSAWRFPRAVGAVVLVLGMLVAGGWCLASVWPWPWPDREEQSSLSPDGAYRAWLEVRVGFLNDWYSLHVAETCTGIDVRVTDRACYFFDSLQWLGSRVLQMACRARYPDCAPLPARALEVELRPAEW